MLIFKSFFRKKTTKIYLVVYTLIIFIICLLLSVREFLEIKQRELYIGSNILISTENIKELEHINNIKKIYKAVKIKIDNYNEMIMINNDKYKIYNNDIIIPNLYKENYRINDKLICYYKDNTKIEFKVKDYDTFTNNSDIVYVSKEIINKYSTEHDNLYLITLKNWEKKDYFMEEIKKINNIDEINIRINNNGDSYITFINTLNVMLIIILILFIIVLIITSYNIIDDEEKKNIIYYKIGYKKNHLKYYNYLKILILIIISFNSSLIIMTALYFMFKMIL